MFEFAAAAVGERNGDHGGVFVGGNVAVSGRAGRRRPCGVGPAASGGKPGFGAEALRIERTGWRGEPQPDIVGPSAARKSATRAPALAGASDDSAMGAGSVHVARSAGGFAGHLGFDRGGMRRSDSLIFGYAAGQVNRRHSALHRQCRQDRQAAGLGVPWNVTRTASATGTRRKREGHRRRR
ncbi:hypothetical protein [Lysobacter gummosus]|uniref:hypothetical protein n=1 Tax=Lysobacter gummosus TaxID=262324 RepID=UPI00362CDB32